ncbi:MAG: phenylalanine--tRNA ligase subunit beta [Bacteriovoracia bacterium]
MKTSWKWLAEFVDLSSFKTPQALGDCLTARGLEVEGIEAQGKGFDKVVVGQILERNKHPQADRLSLCKITLGSGEPLEIVCGAQNMKAGDRVAVAQIGADLPNGLKITKSKIRGVESFGMLCSEEELKLKDKSEGILILPADAPLGKPLAEFLGLDDIIFDLKVTPNRGDCLSHLGLAREIAAATGQAVKKPAVTLVPTTGSPIQIKYTTDENAPQFWGCYLEGVKVGPSPEWVVKRLAAVGQRSINNVVDATNLLLFEVGQPTHAYDADKLSAKSLGVRFGKKDEKLPLLDGQTVTLDGSELVISDGDRAVGLAGVMGGGNSEVQDGTTKLFLECAEFSPSHVRRTAIKHLRRSEAAMRFEKGIDPQGQHYALSRLAQLITQLAGGKIVGGAACLHPSRDPKKYARKVVTVKPQYFTDFLGLEVTASAAQKILQDLGCEVQAQGDTWKVSTPTYRPDLGIPEDLAEEIARTVGYDKIPATIPQLSGMPTPSAAYRQPQQLKLMFAAQDALAEMGFCETVHYAFTSRAALAQFGMQGTPILNPLSEDQEVLVPSLLPEMVRASLHNWNHHFGSEPLSLRLFEIRPSYFVADGVTVGAKGQAGGEMETGVQEKWKLALALSGPRYAGGLNSDLQAVDFYDLKAAVDGLLQSLDVRGIKLQAGVTGPLSALFHPGQSAELKLGTKTLGVMGLAHPALAKKLKFRDALWLAELDWEQLSQLVLARGAKFLTKIFDPWSEFPTIERDFSLLVQDSVSAEQITQLAWKVGKPLVKQVRIFDKYRGHQVAQGMTSVSVRVIFSEEGRSLQESEADQASEKILTEWKTKLGAQLR